MLQSISGSFVVKSLTVFVFGFATAVVAQPAFSQTNSDTPQTSSDKPQDSEAQTADDVDEESLEVKPDSLPTEQQKKLVQEVYQSTKTAKSAKQLTAMVESCDRATKLGLSKKRTAYVRSLKAWALNRRGESRYEVAKQLRAIGNVAQYQRAFDEAITDFNDSLSIDTTRCRTFNARGVAYLLDRQWVPAAKDFTKAVGEKADFAQGYFNRAEALSAMKKFDLAIKDYGTVLSLQANDAQALTGRAHANVELGNFEIALKDYESVLDEYPDNAIALINRGDCHQQAGNWEKSMVDYAAAKKHGQQTLADQRMAWVLATASDDSVRDAKKSLALIEPCVRQSVTPTIAMLETLAAAQAAVGRFDDARKNQSEAIKLTGGTVEPQSLTKTAEGQVAVKPTLPQARMALYVDDKPFVQSQKK